MKSDRIDAGLAHPELACSQQPVDVVSPGHALVEESHGREGRTANDGRAEVWRAPRLVDELPSTRAGARHHALQSALSDPAVGIFLERAHEPGQALSRPEVVRVEKGDEIAPRQADRGIPVSYTH